LVTASRRGQRRTERVAPKYLYILLRLRRLAPDITNAIVNGRSHYSSMP
jgi:hypothetical protein